MSHPLWVRGLKYINNFNDVSISRVAPFMGAWIEIKKVADFIDFIHVAPFMGAWIEIDIEVKE